MRATTLLNRVLDLPGVRVTGVRLDAADGDGSVVVDVALRRRALMCKSRSYLAGFNGIVWQGQVPMTRDGPAR